MSQNGVVLAAIDEPRKNFIWDFDDPVNARGRRKF